MAATMIDGGRARGALRHTPCAEPLTRLRIPSRRIALLLVGLCGGGLTAALHAHAPQGRDDDRTIRAVRAEHEPPAIDGILDDEVWQRAPIATGLTQRDPDEGLPASEKTAFQVAYDDEALYIAIVCYDSEPDRINRRLYRRDQMPNSETDSVAVRLDPHHDHQTGFAFEVGASGAYGDNAISGDSQFDGSYDAVWEVKTRIHDLGWNAEFRIPYHALRFSVQQEYTWGINLQREIPRKQEYAMWALVGREETGISSRNGHIVGIRGIHPPAHIEALPYTVARQTFEPESVAHPDGRASFGGSGADVRYGLSSSMSLNATMNPDFGQVEADPAVLNLTVFETFFSERRPFFVEGSQIFRRPGHSPYSLFYSRRIGKRPGRFSPPSDAEVVDRPDASTILGAAKVTGKTGGKTTIGIMEAVTAREYATVRRMQTDGFGAQRRVEEDHLIEPLTNYLVGRVQQDVLKNSTVGALATSVVRESAESATSGGLDWNLRWRDNGYQVSGQLAGTRAGAADDRHSGYAMSLDARKSNGWLTGGLEFNALSPEFDPNDLGSLSQADRVKTFPWIAVGRSRPWRAFRSMSAMFAYQGDWNYDGVNMLRGLNFWVDGELTNYWSAQVYAYRDMGSMNDWKTRGGPLMRNPGQTGVEVSVASPTRRQVRVDLGGFVAPTDEARHRSVRAGLTVTPTSQLQVSLSPSYGWARNAAEWVANVDDDGDGADDHYVFGALTTNRLDVTTRLSATLTPRLSARRQLLFPVDDN